MKDGMLKIIYKVLRSYAKKIILRHTPFVIAITGSVGKTSTKEAIYSVLKNAFGDEVRCNFGNLNAEIGIPLTILGYEKLPSKYLWPIFLIGAWFKTKAKKYPKYLVLEMGVEHKGDMKYFGTIVKPDIGVITGATPAHVANFKNIEEMQEEKVSMSKIIKKDGVLMINLDDEKLKEIKFDDKISVGIKNQGADCRAENIEIALEKTSYIINYQNHKNKINSKILGEHLIYANLFAFCVGKKINIVSEKIIDAIEKRRSIVGRMNILPGRDGIQIIDDTYNSNPASAKSALKTLLQINYRCGRKVAILGNMNELGGMEKEAHIDVAKYARGKCDKAIFCGKNAEMMYEAYDDKENSEHYKNRAELIKSIDRILQSKDLVLIKASQNGNYFEEIVKELLQDKSTAGEVLVRQGRFWLKKKKLR